VVGEEVKDARGAGETSTSQVRTTDDVQKSTNSAVIATEQGSRRSNPGETIGGSGNSIRCLSKKHR